MRTLVVFYIKETYHIYDPEANIYMEEKNLSSVKQQDIIITCNQSFITRSKIYDIYTIEKVIYFPGPKNISRLNEKYLHKKLNSSQSVKEVLRKIYSLYKHQIKEVKEYGLSDYIDFEADIAGTLAYINSGFIEMKESFLTELEEKMNSFKKEKVLSRKQIIQIANDKKYPLFSSTKGKWDLNYNRLLETGDKDLISHVNASTKQNNITYEKQFYKEKLPINHNQFGAKTGRISTTKPNIQGMQKDWIKGNIYSFDYSGFEVIIFMSLYNQSLLQEYTDSGYKDLYGFLFKKITMLNFNPDKFAEKQPEKRAIFKRMLISILYGATESDIKYLFGEKASKMYSEIVFTLNIKNIKSRLIDHVKRTGRYLIWDKISFTIQDEHSYLFKTTAPMAKEFERKYGKELKKEYWSDEKETYLSRETFHDKLTYEKGIVIQAINSYNMVNKYCLNYHIQGIGSCIIKKTMKTLLSKIKSQILILRHDEFIIDIKDDADIETVKTVMEEVFFKMTKANISVKCKQI